MTTLCLILILSRVEAQSLGPDFTGALDGAWTWFNDERAVIRDGRLYTCYIKSTGHTALSTYDIWLDQLVGEEVHLSTWTEFDDHNNASLMFNADGKLMAFYAKHGTDQFNNHRTALVDRPEGLSDWGAEVQVKSGDNHTYNNAFQLSEMDNVIFNFSRTNGFNPNWKKYNPDGLELTTDTEFVKSGDDRTRPYVKYASNNRNRIEFFFTDGHPRDVDNDLYHMYYEDGALYQTDGVNYLNICLLF